MPRRSPWQLALSAYYVVFGLWPFVHRRSFTAIAGPKPDVFRLEAAGALFAAVGAGLAVRSRPVPEVVLVPLAAVAVEVRHRRRIRPVYLVDAALQLTLSALALNGTRAR